MSSINGAQEKWEKEKFTVDFCAHDNNCSLTYKAKDDSLWRD